MTLIKFTIVVEKVTSADTDLSRLPTLLFNKVSKPIKRGWYQVTHAWLTSTYHDQCGPSMVYLGYMVVEKLIWPQKLDIVVATARKATPMSRLQQLSLQGRQKLWDISVYQKNIDNFIILSLFFPASMQKLHVVAMFANRLGRNKQSCGSHVCWPIWTKWETL